MPVSSALLRNALPAGSCFTRVLTMCLALQVCAYIGLCDASAALQQDGPASRKLLHQKADGALMQRLAAALPAKHRQRMDAVAERKQLGESVQCQFCEMAVTYVKVSPEHVAVTHRQSSIAMAQRKQLDIHKAEL